MKSIQAARRQKAAEFFTPLLPWLTLVTGGLAIAFLVFSLMPLGAP